jgi:hypothetical protein
MRWRWLNRSLSLAEVGDRRQRSLTGQNRKYSQPAETGRSTALSRQSRHRCVSFARRLRAPSLSAANSSACSATDDRLRRHVPSQNQLDEQAEQLYATTDAIAERVRKIGAMALRSISDISRRQRVLDNDAAYVTPSDMLAELRDDNQQLAAYLREAHGLCEEYAGVASASLVENWIDEAERRIWYLFEASRASDRTVR